MCLSIKGKVTSFPFIYILGMLLFKRPFSMKKTVLYEKNIQERKDLIHLLRNCINPEEQVALKDRIDEIEEAMLEKPYENRT